MVLILALTLTVRYADAQMGADFAGQFSQLDLT